MSKFLILILILTSLVSHLNVSPCGSTPSSPIVIDSDDDFVTYGFRGKGLKEDPYVIEGLNIESKGSMSNGIEIKGTHAYFIIRKCEIRAEYIGILVKNVSPGTATIESNVLIGSSNNGGGIVLESNSVQVRGNNCTGFIDGIHTNYADDCYFIGNNLNGNEYHGLSLRFSNNNQVVNNTITGNKGYGLFIIRSSRGNYLYNNTFIDNAIRESYDWDDLYHFVLSSQALDEGSSNVWFSEEDKLGNRWSDYDSSGVYKIDGSANSVDKYPAKVGGSQDVVPKPIDDNSNQGIPGFPFESMILAIFVVLGYLVHVRSSYRVQ